MILYCSILFYFFAVAVEFIYGNCASRHGGYRHYFCENVTVGIHHLFTRLSLRCYSRDCWFLITLRDWAVSKIIAFSEKFRVLFAETNWAANFSVLFPLCVFLYSSRVYFLYFDAFCCVIMGLGSWDNHILVLTLVMSVAYIYFFLPADLNRVLKLEYVCFSFLFLWTWLDM